MSTSRGRLLSSLPQALLTLCTLTNIRTVVLPVEANPSSAEVFFEGKDPFFYSPRTPKPTFEEAAEHYLGEREADRFFKKEEDVFQMMKNGEEFFFNDEKKKSKTMNRTEVVSHHSRMCNCHDVYCGCCFSIKFLGKEKLRGCMEMEYVSRDFAFYITVSINNHIILTRILSGRNPLPYCTTTKYVPLVHFCIRLYDIHHNPQGMSICMRLEATSMRQILFSISFDCIKVDNHKISFYMPPNFTTFGVVGFHMGNTDPYISYNDWTKLHFPLPEVTTPAASPKHRFLWFNWG